MSMFFCVLRPALFVAALLMPVPALAVVINVNGTDYDVLFFTNGFNVAQPSFDENEAALTNTATAPWWGSRTIAQSFAVAYFLQHPPGSFDIRDGGEQLHFAYALDGTDVLGVSFRIDDDGRLGVSFARSEQATGYNDRVYAYVPAAPVPAVPEIDGNALPKALFLLFTLWLWLQVRRRKGQAHAKTA